MEPIPVEFTFTANIFGKTQRHILWNYFTKGWLKWILLALAIFWTVKLLVFNGVLSYLMSLAIAGVFLGLWWLIFSWLSRRNFSKFPALMHPIRYVFSEESVQLNTHTTQSVLQWSTFMSAGEAPEYFLLYQNRVAANPVLKSGFQSATDVERFRVLLRSKGLLK